MKRLLPLIKAVDALSSAAGWLATWAVLFACMVSAGNAVVRYAFDVGSNAWLELQWYFFAVVVLFGASKTLRLNGHVRVDILYGMLTPRRQVWLDLVCLGLFLMPAAVLLTGMSWTLFAESWSINEVSSNAGGLLRWPVKLVLPLGFALLALQGLAEMARRAAMLAGAIPLSTQYERPPA
ncbi:MAG TPA: TRAP transporter small permease subunit [Ramlibacter sp.]|uniref:TRAP transporter small permease subunit n=1 Tax=Ramlibacter sp. TaxID=1917967 RepID=UPI002D7F5706|nr:TRAP transporter small permease subunit [Ramlibacter sp.]HET8746805.1 TRAP transporter small permease subunit [Ramlibacter sp.]